MRASYNVLTEVAKLSQELVSLKTAQRYLTGQAKGFVSNTVQVQSRIVSSSQYAEYRAILCNFTFTGDKPDKRVISKLKFQMYNSSGSKINLTENVSDVHLEAYYSFPGDNPNEVELAVMIAVTGSPGSTDAFYGDFWVVSNDSGILSFKSNLSIPS